MDSSPHGGLELGSAPLQLFSGDQQSRRPYKLPPACFHSDPIVDPYSGLCFFIAGHAVALLATDDTGPTGVGTASDAGPGSARVHPLVGSVPDKGDRDGLGADARLNDPWYLCSDGRGSLYCGSGEAGDKVVRLQLPPACQLSKRGAGSTGSGPACRPPHSSAASGGGSSSEQRAAAVAALTGPHAQRVRATTLRFRVPSRLRGLAHVPSSTIFGGGFGSGPSGSLVLATHTALYRLPLGGQGGGSEGGAGAGAGAGALAAPVLLAGREGGQGDTDGRGGAARFREIGGVVADAEGVVYVADASRASTALRRVAPDGTVTTLGTVDGQLSRPSFLPNGCLALCCRNPSSLLVLDLGLKPARNRPPSSAPAGPPCRTLHADMDALLEGPLSDLTLVVGDRRFPVHRLILIARCDYFRSQLEGGFADGAAAELSLPDADPAAFELLLRFVYTGAVDIPAALAPAVAELADRLLLPELCSDAQAVVLSDVAPDTVVDTLLWAERLGGSFPGLLSSLKAWAVDHYEEVRREAGESLRRLMVQSPDMALELTDGLLAKRQRIV
ncbi:hypothetical protein HYH03_001949 [Edaphochlamys debaryana]|uniref:BTB domain-containing protein n=1 Tax=Edaphochlamys debaryana TaxID=47281 RepID=A0A835YKR7_9CHLO|nr:hypothetical protein HYH03_001949 [Edaphochlamys debaryana]|eukprot:KAG2500375.1 hypothetical protein HYH03_001949 [Edaphochlamys debaryana]